MASPITLSNADLIAEYCKALDLYNQTQGSTLAERRLDRLHQEIARRERMGSLTDDDWREG